MSGVPHFSQSFAMRRIFILLCCLSLSALSNAEECERTGKEDFSRFLTRFSIDKAFAVSRTVYPLNVVLWHHGLDGTDVEPPTRSLLTKEKDEATPSLGSYMSDNGLTSYVLAVESRAALVEVYRDGTNWVETFHFARNGRCWYLREFQDHSSSNFR
jgi:hypothetical protein